MAAKKDNGTQTKAPIEKTKVPKVAVSNLESNSQVNPQVKPVTPAQINKQIANNAATKLNKPASKESAKPKQKTRNQQNPQNNLSTTKPVAQEKKDIKAQINSLFSWAISPISNLKREKPQKPVLKVKVADIAKKTELKIKPMTKVSDSAKTAKSKDTNSKKVESQIKVTSTKSKRMLARITVYWAYGSGTDHWSAKKQSSTGTKLQCGEHAAVDPKVIPYGSKLEVQKNGQDLLVKAVDTGSAVKKRKAAIAMAKNQEQRKAPVIDLFFEKKSDALHYAKSNPPYQWVDVHLPN